MHEPIAGRGRIHQLRPAFSLIPSLAFAPFVPVAPLSGTTAFSAPLTVYDRSNKMRALSWEPEDSGRSCDSFVELP
jgi:hypothetical protein